MVWKFEDMDAFSDVEVKRIVGVVRNSLSFGEFYHNAARIAYRKLCLCLPKTVPTLIFNYRVKSMSVIIDLKELLAPL